MVRSERGFTLVEMIVAVTIFTWGLLALLGAAPCATSSYWSPIPPGRT
jgi:prepilin-type N-terminal cleavage/methylation domain-containing protein